MYGRLLAPAAAAVALSIAACGGSGIPSRPIETLIYVSAAEGTPFMFASTPDEACGSDGTGIQAPHADHEFGDRIFETPYLFVLENTRQPMRAVIRNLDPTSSIQVNLYLGQTPQKLANQGMIGPNQCSTIVSAPGTLPVPNPTIGPEVRVEVCSPVAGLTTSCINTAPPPNNPPPQGKHFFYFASIGDINTTNITNCVLAPILQACQAPSTFMLQQPQEQVDAVMSVNSGQNPGDPIPNASLRVELYIDGQFKGFEGGTEPVVSATF